MSERTIRLVTDLPMASGCSRSWQFMDASEIHPLRVLAEAGSERPSMHIEGWNFFCPQHNVYFPPGGECPQSRVFYEAGETITIEARVADGMVKRGEAVYPTHEPAPSEGLQETLDRTNALMDDMGFPHLDSEALRTFSVKGQGGKKHYAKPKDARLAQDLGLAPDEIAQMRDLSKGG